MWNTKGR